MLNGLGLFAGIGGLELGLERAGLCKTRCFVEYDKYAQRVLAKRFPDVPIWDDVRTFHAPEGSFDVISGGFPCQDISVAGKGKGIKQGTRSGLWFEFRRIISEVQPLFSVIENVPMLTVRGGDRVILDLAEIGYNAEWTVISAAGMGAPHLRKRMFIIAYPNTDNSRYVHREFKEQSAERGINAQCKFDGLCEDVAYTSSSRRNNGCDNERKHKYNIPEIGTTKKNKQSGSGWECGTCENGSDVADSLCRRYSSQEKQICTRGDGFINSDWWTTEPNVGRVAIGVPSRVDRLKCLGNAVVPACAEYIGRLIMEAINE